MMDKAQVIVMLDGVVVLLLIMWARQWLHTFEIYKDKVEDASAYCLWGLTIAYTGIFIALLSMGALVVGAFMDSSLAFSLSISLLASALFLVLVQSLQSTQSAISKLLQEGMLDEPVQVVSRKRLRIWLYAVGGATLLIFGIVFYIAFS